MSQNMSAHKAKEEAKERDNYECQFCGVTNEQHKEEYDEAIHAHHIIKQRNGGPDTPDNLITVCRDCHNTIEQTQAKALTKIKNNELSSDKMDELEAENEDLKELYEQNQTTIAEFNQGLDEVLEATIIFDVFVVVELAFDGGTTIRYAGTNQKLALDTVAEIKEGGSQALLKTTSVQLDEIGPHISKTDYRRCITPGVVQDRIRDKYPDIFGEEWEKLHGEKE